MIKTDYIMGKMPYKKALWKLALPSIFTFLVMSAYITIDRILISRFVGPEGMGAMQYVGPSANLIAAISTIVAVGTKVNFSIMLGKKENKEVNSLLSNSYLLMILAAIFLMFLTYNLGPKIGVAFNAPKELANLASDYYKVFAIGVFAQSIVYLFESVFQAKGYTKIIMQFTLAAQIINLLLDVIFMKNLQWGIAGAAWATTISMYVNLLLILIYVLFVRKEFLLNIFKYKIKYNNVKKIFKMGIPAMTESIILSIKIFVFTFFLTKIGTKNDIIAYSAARTAWITILIPVFGIAAAGGPMIGYNFGSKNYERLRDISVYKFKILQRYFLIAFVLMIIFPTTLLKVFNVSAYGNATYIIRTIGVGIIFVAHPIIWGTIFQSTGLAKQTVTISLIRNVIIFIPIVILFSLLNDLRILLIALPTSDLFGALFTKWYVSQQINKDKYKHLALFKK